ncbi:MAG TPA: ATP-binding protein [Syntrophales bacterium]|nr:ATP-binding protein [Syntrophales bacterium]
MKKKIIFGLSVFALMFFFGGVYVITTMEKIIYELHNIAALRHVVSLRKDLLISIEENQNRLKGARDEAGGGIPENKSIIEAVKTCLTCHHFPPTEQTINNLRKQIEAYHELTHETLTAPAPAVPERHAEAALRMGDDLINKVKDLIIISSSNLDKKEKEIMRGIAHRKSILFLLVTVGPFFAVGFAFILIQSLTKPVNGLLDATRRLKAGDLAYRIRGLHGEFREVAESFNEMAESLKKQMQEMQRTEQLRVSGEMAAGIAHEIRNPLAGMKVSIEVLLAELDLEERDRIVLSKIIGQIRQIELLMKNLLNFARPVAAQPAAVNINKILERTIYFIEKHPSFSSRDAHKRIVRELDDNLPDILADPQQLQQVFLNLFLNAADATPEGGKITVKTCYDKTEGNIAVELHDTGKGIPDELKEKIFQPFFTTKGKGTGLGLAVSKRVVEEHGGAITGSNNASGGAVFRIILPVKMGEKGSAKT